MSRQHQSLRLLILSSLCVLLAGCTCPSGRERHSTPATEPSASATTRPTRLPHNFARWEREIAAFEAADRTNPPPKGGILFTGSSTIRLWSTLAQDFPKHKVINRGFGGSEIADATHFADRIIFPYEPTQILIRAGGNDINAGRLPEEVAQDFAEFVRTIHGRLPNTEIIFISISPAPARWAQKDKGFELNRLIYDFALHTPRVGYVDTWYMTLQSDGRAREEIFVDDKLHFNAMGYRLLVDRVRPYLPIVR